MDDELDDDDLINEASAEAGGVVKDKTRAGTGRRAARNLQRARKLYEVSDWQPSKEAEFRLQESMILALLDLAEAIREQSPPR